MDQIERALEHMLAAAERKEMEDENTVQQEIDESKRVVRTPWLTNTK